MNQNLRFSGHETFICKQFWLKKGFDFASESKSFTSPEAVIEMGVGKNMVTAINYWAKSFDIISDDHEPTFLGDYLFGRNGRDIYLEDIGTLWLLHYYLVTKGRATIYQLTFNEFIRERTEFTKEQLQYFIRRTCFDNTEYQYNEGTIKKDVSVFVRNYVKPRIDINRVEIEEDYSALLLDLDLIRNKKVDNTDQYVFQIGSHVNLPIEVFLYSILDKFEGKSVSFRELLRNTNSPAQIFCLSQDGLYSKIEQLTKQFSGIVFSRTAGNEVLQFTTEYDKWEVLDEYYDKTTL